MTMLSSRVDGQDAADAQAWADRVGIVHRIPRIAFRRRVAELSPKRAAEACRALAAATGC